MMMPYLKPAFIILSGLIVDSHALLVWIKHALILIGPPPLAQYCNTSPGESTVRGDRLFRSPVAAADCLLIPLMAG